MNRLEIRELAIALYYSATSKHDLDDNQWNLILDSINKKYWTEAARGVGSLLALDTSDLACNVAGGFDYSGSLYKNNDFLQPTDFSQTTYWTATNATLVNRTTVPSPDGAFDSWLWTNTANPAITTIAPTAGIVNTYPGGVIEIHAKAASAATVTWLYITTGSGSVWFDPSTGTVGQNTITGATAVCTPISYNGFPYQVGVTSSATPTVSPSGWYRCTVILPYNISVNSVTFGLSSTNGGTATVAGNAMYIYGARKTMFGATAATISSTSSNMIDPNGVYMPIGVELKYLGRYIKLDYEIPQDRYLYNIAFGQVQVLIPSAWTLMGEQILLLPKTTGGQVVRISYIPKMGDWTADNTPALNGFLPEWHTMLAYEAAVMMAGGAAERIIPLRDDLKTQWKEFIQSRQRQDGRKIRYVPYE